jgi:hypothetical protein
MSMLMKPCFIRKKKAKWGSTSPSWTDSKNQLQKLILLARSRGCKVWTTVTLYGWSLSSFLGNFLRHFLVELHSHKIHTEKHAVQQLSTHNNQYLTWCYKQLYCPLQNPTLGIFITEGGNVLGWQTGLWSTKAKVWGIVPRAAWHWGGDSSVTNNAFGAPGSTPLYQCLPHARGSAGGDFRSPVLVEW